MRRLALLIAIALAALVAFAGPAFAHVTVSAPGATRGGSDQEITFRVPVEKNVDVVGLTVALPTNTPIASVDVQPVPGWTDTEKTVKLAHPIKTDDGNITTAVSQVEWRAKAGQGLKPGEFGAFTIIAGQLPDVGSLTFPALEHYVDGSVTKWIQVAAAGSNAEPDSPAPVLNLARSGADHHLVAGSAPTTGQRAPSNTGPWWSPSLPWWSLRARWVSPSSAASSAERTPSLPVTSGYAPPSTRCRRIDPAYERPALDAS